MSSLDDEHLDPEVMKKESQKRKFHGIRQTQILSQKKEHSEAFLKCLYINTRYLEK